MQGFYGLPDWILSIIGYLLIAAVGVYLLASGYFVLTSPDALRSEQFVLNKMTIQQSKLGDNSTGVKKLEASGESVQEIKPAEEHE